MDDHRRFFLRHTLATLAYRGAKSLRDAPPDFAGFLVGERPRTPAMILAHLGDLMDWALSMAEGHESWHDSKPLPWPEEVARFFQALRGFDDFLAGDAPLKVETEKLFQGPVADALTHVGQIAMLRRLAACPIRGENYSRAEIAAGKVGPEQAAPKREFD